MQNTKRNLANRIVGIVLSGVIVLMSCSRIAVVAKDADNSPTVDSVSVSENEKKAEQYYRTRTGKCYHKGSCSYLKHSKIEITDKEIKEADLKPCSKCCK